MKQTRLCDLITYLEYGTKLHIGVLFFGNRHSEALRMPYAGSIHPSPVCDRMKLRPRGLARCLRCRRAALQRAVEGRRAFGGLCINGVYEYTHPVIEGDEVIAVIFVGNILPQEPVKLMHRLTGQSELLDTLERNFPEERCAALCEIVEGHIRTLLLHPQVAGGEDPLLENLKQYIEANLEYGVSVSELAAIFHYNEKYLGRLFKSRTGCSLGAYVTARRLAMAAELLAGEGSVTAVAARVGFNSVTYFNRVFKGAFGMTPSAYRAAGRLRTPYASGEYDEGEAALRPQKGEELE